MALKSGLIKSCLIGVVSSGLTCATIFAVLVVDEASRAELALHSILDTLGACTHYVEEHSGQWPGSWRDLAPYFSESRMQAAQQYVAIDFAADPKKIAAQPASEFGAIRPKGVCFPYLDSGQVAALLKATASFAETPP